jgi:hypothetical protein
MRWRLSAFWNWKQPVTKLSYILEDEDQGPNMAILLGSHDTWNELVEPK